MNLQMRELMERYLDGDLSEIELEAFLTMVRNDPDALGEMKKVLFQQALLYDALRTPLASSAASDPQAEAHRSSRVAIIRGSGVHASVSGRRGSDRSRAARVSSKRLLPPKGSVRAVAAPAGPGHFGRWQWPVAVAALLIVVSGLIALWVDTQGNQEVIQAERHAHRRQEILRQIAELESEAKAVQRPAPPVLTPHREPPQPQPPQPAPSVSPDETKIREHALRIAAEEQQRREAEETALLIDARRQQLLARLREFPSRHPRADDTDEEPERPVAANKTEMAAAPTGAPAVQEIGCVTFVEPNRKSGVVVRTEDEEEVRLDLRAGMRLNRGDRIETVSGNEHAAATVELAGGAKLDLDQKTVVVVLEQDEARLSAGRIYACVAPPSTMESDLSSLPPFSLETTSGRYLARDVRAEIFASAEFRTSQTHARVDQGLIHLMNKKGLAIAHKGQELRSLAGQAPQRAEGFSGPIWRGRDVPVAGLPFGRSNLLIFSNENPAHWMTEDYAMLLSHRGQIRLASLQVSQGNLADPLRQFQLLAREASQLRNMGVCNFPPPAQGVTKPLVRPPSGKPEDTRAESSTAVMEILASARVSTAERPLVVVCGGSLTDVACAWLLDRSVAERVVVVGPFAKPGIEFDFDPWAAEIVLRNLRCVLGAHRAMPIDADRLSRIADPRWVAFAGKAAGGDPEFPKLAVATVPDFVKSTQRYRFTGIVAGSPEFQADPAGRIWLMTKTDPNALLREFDQTFLRDRP